MCDMSFTGQIYDSSKLICQVSNNGPTATTDLMYEVFAPESMMSLDWLVLPESACVQEGEIYQFILTVQPRSGAALRLRFLHWRESKLASKPSYQLTTRVTKMQNSVSLELILMWGLFDSYLNLL